MVACTHEELPQPPNGEHPIIAAVAIISGGETTVTLRGKGRGGRCSEFLLSLAIELDGLEGTSALAADTDGIDGSESNAGALLLPDSLARASARGLAPKAITSVNDVMEEKYIALFQNIEVWNDYKRTYYPAITAVANANFGNKVPGRLFYGTTEANANPNLEAAEDFAESARAAGVSYEELLEKIMGLGSSRKDRTTPTWIGTRAALRRWMRSTSCTGSSTITPSGRAGRAVPRRR